MEFDVVFYYTDGPDPVVPMREFLETLRISNPRLHTRTLAALRKLHTSTRHGGTLTRIVDRDAGIFELRTTGSDISRSFFFFRAGRQIVVTHGYVKKQQQIDRRELERARRYKVDWEERFR